MARTVIVDIRNFEFTPVSIQPGTFVVWRNLDPVVHSAETLPQAPVYFNAGAMHPGEASSPVYFETAGSYSYLCRYHQGMTGVVTVLTPTETPMVADDGGHHGHLRHFHGFVTGGRSGQRLFMTHTPVIADERHDRQVILQGSLVEQTHVEAYNALRTSDYGDRRVQIFHDHLSMPDLAEGKIKMLPESFFEYYPQNVAQPVPGLEEKIPVRIDTVLYAHRFEPDSDYPEGLAYLMYGDEDDVFIDHHISRAPNFHSVAKLATAPDFWTAEHFGGTLGFRIPSKRMYDVSPKLARRVAYVDNSFHLFWLPSPGVYASAPQDPLLKRAGGPAAYEVVLDDGRVGQIEIGRFIHFDFRLLNYGVLIVQ